jgi:hypothetical protein
MFVRLFNGANSCFQIMYRRIRKYNVIIVNKLVRDLGESMVANTKYGISVEVQRKTSGSLFNIVGYTVEILTGIN